MKRYLPLLITLFLSSVSLFGQQTEDLRTTADQANDPTAYPIANLPPTQEMQDFDASFPEQGVGFLHVYAAPKVDPNDKTYLLAGTEQEEDFTEYLPKKFQRLQQKMRATVYTAAAIRGNNESLYIVRFDGPFSDRLEMFAIRGEKVKHLRTLAYLKCSNGTCAQLDSYITDIDKDTDFDLIQIQRKQNSNGTFGEKKTTYTMVEPARKWKKANFENTPWNSVEFFEPSRNQ